MPEAFPTMGNGLVLPPDLVVEMGAQLEPGESLRWLGRGTSSATLVAVIPFLALIAVLVGPFLVAAYLFGDDATYRRAPGWFAELVPASELAAASFVIVAGALAFWLFVAGWRVVTAPRTLVGITDRRLLIRRGAATSAIPLPAVELVEASGSGRRAHMSFRWAGLYEGDGAASQALFGVTKVDAALAAAESLGIPTSDLRSTEAAGHSSVLVPGETVRWSCRRGFRAVGPSRLTLFLLSLPMPLPLALSLWWVWSTTAANMTDRASSAVPWAAGMTVILALILGPMALFPLVAAPAFFRELFTDVFGALAVTDRRIIFTYPWTGTVQREVAAESIIEVSVTGPDARGEGEVALHLQGMRTDERLRLFAVPDPQRAAAEIGRLTRPHD